MNIYQIALTIILTAAAMLGVGFIAFLRSQKRLQAKIDKDYPSLPYLNYLGEAHDHLNHALGELSKYLKDPNLHTELQRLSLPILALLNKAKDIDIRQQRFHKTGIQAQELTYIIKEHLAHLTQWDQLNPDHGTLLLMIHIEAQKKALQHDESVDDILRDVLMVIRNRMTEEQTQRAVDTIMKVAKDLKSAPDGAPKEIAGTILMDNQGKLKTLTEESDYDDFARNNLNHLQLDYYTAYLHTLQEKKDYLVDNMSKNPFPDQPKE